MQIDEKSILNDDIEDRILKVEDYCKIKFPSAYLEFILKYNLGIPLTNEFDFNKHIYVVERFLGFINEFRTSELGNFDIAVTLSQIDTRLTDNRDLVGDEVIPVAMLFSGDYACLDFRNNVNDPEVCIWYHKESEEFEPITRRVADNFIEFLKMLK